MSNKFYRIYITSLDGQTTIYEHVLCFFTDEDTKLTTLYIKDNYAMKIIVLNIAELKEFNVEEEKLREAPSF